tara:strand:- start:95 stop:253 length:159 start_codon:yes stop_codon:yes gene_type:complete
MNTIEQLTITDSEVIEGLQALQVSDAELIKTIQSLEVSDAYKKDFSDTYTRA